MGPSIQIKGGRFLTADGVRSKQWIDLASVVRISIRDHSPDLLSATASFVDGSATPFLVSEEDLEDLHQAWSEAREKASS